MEQMAQKKLTGRELDKAIVDKVFGQKTELCGCGHKRSLHAEGWRFCQGNCQCHQYTPFYSIVPAYSTDPTACAALKKKLLEMGFMVVISTPDPSEPDDHMWEVNVWSVLDLIGQSEGETEEIAVCRAALKAVEAKQ